MTWQPADLTIEDVLADPMILAMRNADRVDPKAFETLLRSKAREGDLRKRGSAGTPPAQNFNRSSMPPTHVCGKVLDNLRLCGAPQW